MDYAQELIRSVARSFYPPESILIIDAVLLHSALRDDDLAFLMGSQTKHTRKLCSRLREDGLLNVHSRPEIKPGAHKAFNRDYYYINYHRAIDIIKYRLKSMTREVEKRFGQTAEEKKEYFCDRCKSEYTMMEVLDSRGGDDGNFICRRCGAELRQAIDDGQNSVGHEMQSRLNAQLAAFEKLMRQIDDVEVPENDFEAALANARPVQRDPNLNPVVKSEVAPSHLPAATVHGMRTEDKVQVSLHDASQALQYEADERERKARLAEQNALPSWHLTSTVTGERTELGMKEEAMRREREANGIAAIRGTNEDDIKAEEDKKVVEPLQDNSQLDAYFAAVREDEAKRNREELEDDDEDDDEDDEDEDDDEFEDVALENGDPSNKRIKGEDGSGRNGTASSNGVTSIAMRGGDISADGSASSTPGNNAASTKPRDEQGEAAANGSASNNISPEDSDEDDFEDAL